MKVDKIITGYGDIDVEYSTFTKGFFIKKLPEKLMLPELKKLVGRDNSFLLYKDLAPAYKLLKKHNQ